jgi:hypothetical protein
LGPRLWLQEGRGQRADRGQYSRICCLGVATLALPLGIVSQQHGWIITDALRNGMHRHSAVQQQRGMRAAEMVKLEIGKAELRGTPRELLAEIPRVAGLDKREVLTGGWSGWKD